MTRRTLFGAIGLAGGAAVLPARAAATPREWASNTAQSAIPRWRGFNLLDLFQAMTKADKRPVTSADDFRWMRDWGFNFVRIPMDYWLWIDSDWQKTKTLSPDAVFNINPAAFDQIDRLVEMGRRYGLHVSLNFHRAPGYCINAADREPFVLWSDKRAGDAFAHHWAIFAQRYKGVSEFDLSFNLLNEAPKPREGYMSRDDYCRTMSLAIDAIRAISPKRLILIDGLDVGNSVVTEMIPTGVAQSVHAYSPGNISHYRASWVDKESKFPPPAWPLRKDDGSVSWGRERLEQIYAPWAELARQGIGVHCGECGCFSKTPHDVFLAWFSDVMEILAGHGIGYALWNLHGSFGVLDSDRADVEYEDWYGSKLDRKLLSVLQKF